MSILPVAVLRIVSFGRMQYFGADVQSNIIAMAMRIMRTW